MYAMMSSGRRLSQKINSQRVFYAVIDVYIQPDTKLSTASLEKLRAGTGSDFLGLGPHQAQAGRVNNWLSS